MVVTRHRRWLPVVRFAVACGSIAIWAATGAGAADGIEVSVESRSVQPGELVVLTLTAPQDTTRLRVRAFDRSIPAFRVGGTTWRALVGIDLDAAIARHPVAIRAEVPGRPPVTTNHDLAVEHREFPTRRLTVSPSFVDPPPDALRRIQREAAELQKAWTQTAAEPLWAGAFIRPVPDPANSAFGSRSIFNGQPRSPHAGADFRSAAGTPIKAPNGGRVTIARDLYFTGNTVLIDHGLGLFSLFAHLSELAVAPGDRVETGQVVGRVGATGRVTGAHLHWTVRANGARVDPLSLLAVLGEEGAAR
jgi:murein DD-endopeptidase MepM/ murein hydrolase activator NlpD